MSPINAREKIEKNLSMDLKRKSIGWFLLDTTPQGVLVVSNLRLETNDSRFDSGWLLPICRGELPAGNHRIIFKCLWSGWKWYQEAWCLTCKYTSYWLLSNVSLFTVNESKVTRLQSWTKYLAKSKEIQ